VEKGAERSWVKEDMFGSNIFCFCWDKAKMPWVAWNNCE